MIKSNLTRFIPQRIPRYGKVDLCPLDGDTFVLQFLNTQTNRGGAQPKNYLKNYDDFITWCYEIRLIDQDDYNILCQECYCYIQEAEGIMNKVIMARATLYDLVCCAINDEPAHPNTMRELNMFNDEANKHIRYEMTAYGLQEIWFDVDEEMNYPFWRMIKCAVSFLSSADIKYIKTCSCGNFFLDTTKNNRKRWCNAARCGASHRARVHYRLKNPAGIQIKMAG